MGGRTPLVMSLRYFGKYRGSRGMGMVQAGKVGSEF